MTRTRFLLMLALLAAGCDGTADEVSLPDAGASDSAIMTAEVDSGTAADSAVEVDAAVVNPNSVCPPAGQRQLVQVLPGVLPSDMLNWTCENRYLLLGPVVVYSGDPVAPQVLRIGPGVLVQGRGATETDAPGLLLVTRTGRLEAEGTVEDPIVFTSSEGIGARARGDWGGITFTGRAGRARSVEGMDPTYMLAGVPMSTYLEYGPFADDSDGGVSDASAEVSDAGVDGDASMDDAGATNTLSAEDAAWSCGSLKYVRVEFASYELANGSETNAIQLYACGSDTHLDYVQSHRSGDDGIELFGGSPTLKHFVATGASDEQLDWDDGYHGCMQFVVGHKYTDTSSGEGIEGGSSADAEPARGRVHPRVLNMTLIGTNGAGGAGAGLKFQGAAEGYFRNLIISGFNSGYINVVHTITAENVRATPPLLTIRNSILFRAMAGQDWPDVEAVPDAGVATQPLRESMFFSDGNQVGVDPQLVLPFNETAPDYMPVSAGGPTSSANAEVPMDVAACPGFFDTSAQFVGAFAPGGTNWMAGWTSFPAD